MNYVPNHLNIILGGFVVLQHSSSVLVHWTVIGIGHTVLMMVPLSTKQNIMIYIILHIELHRTGLFVITSFCECDMMSILLVLISNALLLSGARIIEAEDGERYLHQPNVADVHRSIIPGPEGLPFSKAVRVGGTLYLAGNIGLTGSKGGEPVLVQGGVEAETRKTLENMGKVLREAGSSFDKVVKTTVMLTDIKDYEAVNKVYASFFSRGNFPARSAYAVAALPLGAKVEIEAVAIVGDIVED